MIIYTIGMQKIVEATGIGRPHLYTGIHKALRKYMSEVLTSVGQLDASDDLQCREVMADVQQLLDVLHGHVETENTMVPPPSKHAIQAHSRASPPSTRAMKSPSSSCVTTRGRC